MVCDRKYYAEASSFCLQMSSEHSWDLVAANNMQRRAVGKNWESKENMVR
jgi:hypothetical protein